jgi:transaldolase / glucose-6-phosphate isomerase
MEGRMSSLKLLAGRGQSVWLDFLSREFLDKGALDLLVEADGLVGVTSNPLIFEKAIGESDQYDLDIKAALAGGLSAIGTIYEQLAVADIRRAAAALAPVYEATSGRDGFVSLEVSPYLAMDTEATIAEATRLWNAVDRTNLMIKVPGTEPGIPAIRQLLSDGLNINITLLFSRGAYEQVIEAHMAALEHRAAMRLPIDRIASVASFFVSRIDTVADKLLEEAAKSRGEEERAALERMRGKIAIAIAKLAYQIFRERFSGARWEKLAALGASPQRLLWASTGAKNPAYRDVLYVEELIGPQTVNTMPLKTLDAFRDHGSVRADTLAEGIDDARAILASLERAGISLDRITSDLVVDGVRLFSEALDKLLGVVAAKRRHMLGAALDGMTSSLGSMVGADADTLMQTWRQTGNIRRLWAFDPTMWTGQDEDRWLGWLEVVDRELQDLDRLAPLQQQAREEQFRDVLVLGMGGSSLGPEVIGRSIHPAEGYPRIRVLDSTDPVQIRAAEHELDLERTLFIASSKSGSTLEPNILLEYFFARMVERVGEKHAGERFIAITDPQSALETVANRRGFRQTYFGLASIGGRYSVLSKFGLVPLALTGRNVRDLLQRARVMVRSCGPDVPPEQNPGVTLGLAFAAGARHGRDKVTVVASPSIAGFGAWCEQLIAESTGKQGLGLIPIDGEPLLEPDVYGSDRVFVYVRDGSAPDAAQDRSVAALAAAGRPIIRIDIAGPDFILQEFFRWEMAVAVAGAALGINPFDQPDVEASKLASRELTEAYEEAGSLPPETPVFRDDGIALFADESNARALKDAGAGNTLDSWLQAHFARIRAGDYAATLAYVERCAAHAEVLQDLRAAILARKHVATCLGFGPRYLHSTGQAYKGGPNTGVFLQITTDDDVDLAIPGRNASFAVVKAAQARGDFRVLCERGRRLLRAHIAHDVDAGLLALREAAKRALM